MIIPYLTLVSLLSTLTSTSARKITVTNLCPSTVWPAMLTPKDIGSPIPSHPTGWELPSGDSTSFEVAENWTAGRIWARTGCVLQDGRLRCLTGQCGEPQGKEGKGSLECAAGGEAPATLAEFTLAGTGADHYDLSLVDGFNVPMIILPSADCPKPDCPVNINAKCPEVLRTGLDQNGANLGCAHSCIAGFGQEKYGNRACCSGGYNDPTLCAICGVDFYNVFKDGCPNAYAYAYDEKSETALFTCPSTSHSDYEIVFCPGGTDYVGPKTASTEYDNDLATCKNKVTSGKAVFVVKPSPTAGARIGDIKYTAGAGNGGVPVSTSRPVVVKPTAATSSGVPVVKPTGATPSKAPAKPTALSMQPTAGKPVTVGKPSRTGRPGRPTGAGRPARPSRTGRHGGKGGVVAPGGALPDPAASQASVCEGRGGGSGDARHRRI